MPMRYVWLILLAACRPGEAQRSPRDQLTQCLVISDNGSALTRCLVAQKNWTADSALREGLTFQRSIDSAQAVRDSAEHVAEAARVRAEHAETERIDRIVAEQHATIDRIDSAYALCVRRALEAARDRTTGRYEADVYESKRPQCQRAWLDARRNAKLPALPPP
jgi:hypothetical protein